MTGQGEGHCNVPMGGMMVAEARSVNNRHLKLNLRAGDGLQVFESEIETLVRTHVRRGTIQLNLMWSGRPSLDLYQIQTAVIESYIQQCSAISSRLGVESGVKLADLLALPGVVSESMQQRDESPELLEAVTTAVESALKSLNEMRAKEGQSMANEVQTQLVLLGQLCDIVEQRAPEVLLEYRQRLKTRVATAVAEAISAGEAAPLSEPDLIREVALMSDKADIREEIVRLRSHFTQFDSLVRGKESQGRKLDFLVQEMFRETNTIGSKASDAFIAQRVVDMKSTLEQIRELIQNVE
jgi:uncharacterized protein (TIGR00255 family)